MEEEKADIDQQIREAASKINKGGKLKHNNAPLTED